MNSFLLARLHCKCLLGETSGCANDQRSAVGGNSGSIAEDFAFALKTGGIEFAVHKWVLMIANVRTNVFINTNNKSAGARSCVRNGTVGRRERDWKKSEVIILNDI